MPENTPQIPREAQTTTGTNSSPGHPINPASNSQDNSFRIVNVTVPPEGATGGLAEVWQTAQTSDGLKVYFSDYDKDSADKRYYVRSRKGNEGKQFFGTIEEVIAAEREDIARAVEFNNNWAARIEENPNILNEIHQAQISHENLQKNEDTRKMRLVQTALGTNPKPGQNRSDGGLSQTNGIDRNLINEAQGMSNRYPGASPGEKAVLWALEKKAAGPARINKISSSGKLSRSEEEAMALQIYDRELREHNNADEILWQAGLSEDKQNELIQSLTLSSKTPAGIARTKETQAMAGSQDNTMQDKSKAITLATTPKEQLRQIQIALGTNPQPGKPRGGSRHNTNGIDRNLISNLNVVDKYRNDNNGIVADASDGEKAVLWALQTKAKGATGLAYEHRNDISQQEHGLLVQRKAINDGTWKPSDGYYTSDTFDPTGMSADNYLSNPEKYMPDPRAPGEDGPYGFNTPNGMVRIPGTDRGSWQWARDNGYDYREGGLANGAHISGPKGGYNTGFTTDESKKGDHQKFLEAQAKANGTIKVDLTGQAQVKNAMIQRDLDNADEILWQAGLSEDKQQEMMQSFGFISTASPAGIVGSKEVLALTGSQNNVQNEKTKDQLPASGVSSTATQQQRDQNQKVDSTYTGQKDGNSNNNVTPAAVRTEKDGFSPRNIASPEVMSARKSAVESRLQKIAAQRQPYGGAVGATSVVKDSSILVPPPITGGTSNNGLPNHR